MTKNTTSQLGFTRNTGQRASFTGMTVKQILLLLFLLMFVSGAYAGTADVAQVGDTIYVWGTNADANLTYIETQVSNSSALAHTGTIFLAGANIHVNGTSTTIYINDSDCTWLKLNCTDGDVSNFRVDGYFEMNNSKITSWNTTSSAVVDQTSTTMHIARPAIRFGSGSNDVHVNISNSNISHSGYNASEDVWGIYFNRWMDGTIYNTTLSYLYSIYVTNSDRNTFNYVKIYNNSAYGICLKDYNDDDSFTNSEVYYNNYLASIDGLYGGGGIKAFGQPSNNLLLDNVSIHDGNAALTYFDMGSGFIMKNCEIYNTTYRGIELATAHGGIVENNTVYNIVHPTSTNSVALYCVYASDQTFRNNTVHDCYNAVRLYSVSNVSGKIYDNNFYDNTYHIFFRNTATYNNTVENNTISGSGFDIISYLGANNNTVQDLNNYDNDIEVSLDSAGSSVFINYTNNKIMSNSTSAAEPIITNTYYSTHSSMFMKRNESNPSITVYLYNGTLTAGTTNVTILSVNEWNETAGYESYNITVNSSNATEVCTFTANVANATDLYGCYVDNTHIQDARAVNGIVSWEYTGGFSTEHDLEINWTSDWFPSIFGFYYNNTYPIEITTKGYEDHSNIFSREPTLKDSNATSTFKIEVTTT